MSTKFSEVVCDEHGIGGCGEFCGSNSTQLGRINILYHVASGCKYVPRAMIFEIDPSVVGAVTLNRRSANSSAQATS
jgi:tubulin beta